MTIQSQNAPQISISQARHYIAWRCARELPSGVVNLGIGIPIIVADYMASNQVILHSENGILGMGPTPEPGKEDPDLVNAKKLPITAMPYTSYFDSSLSFAIMRGGHLDATVVGGLQVAENGDLASWAIPGEDVLGVGGVMDLVVGTQNVIIAMLHSNAQGEPKIVPECTYPLTAPRSVSTLVTEFAVFKMLEGKLWLVELIKELDLAELKKMTPAHYEIASNLTRPSRTEALAQLKVSS